MKNLKVQVMALLALFAMGSCDLNSDDPVEPPLTKAIQIKLTPLEKEILAADKQNAMELFYRVANEESISDASIPQSTPKSNFMISPFSLNMALTMAWNGAKGETKEAIEEALGYKPEYREALNAYYKKMGESFVKTDPRTDLVIANSLWYREDIVPKKKFSDVLRNYYYAYTKGVNFVDTHTKDLMNNWCKEMTRGVIDNVIDQTNPEDLMYLMNALYFKGMWSDGFKFKTSDTKNEDFTLKDGSKVKVAMMHQKTKMQYQENDDFSAISLPYGNGAYNMVVLLPKEGSSVLELAEKLSNRTNSVNYSNWQEAEVNLFLPKFKFKYDIKLNDILKAMGMELAFSGAADFTDAFDIASQVSYVKQFTGIEVNEKGTEAAAVTVVSVGVTSVGPSQPRSVDFKADRSFAFMVQENSTGSILFMGSVGNPNE